MTVLSRRCLARWACLAAVLLSVSCSRACESAAPAKMEAGKAFQLVDIVKNDPRDLNKEIQRHMKQARALKLKPVAELWAPWCPPCVALAKSMTDARMQEAFAGTYVMRFNIDEWPTQLAELGFDASTIPAFVALDAKGRPTPRAITGGAWKEDIAENMAPPLKAFFQDTAPLFH